MSLSATLAQRVQAAIGFAHIHEFERFATSATTLRGFYADGEHIAGGFLGRTKVATSALGVRNESWRLTLLLGWQDEQATAIELDGLIDKLIADALAHRSRADRPNKAHHTVQRRWARQRTRAGSGAPAYERCV